MFHELIHFLLRNHNVTQKPLLTSPKSRKRTLFVSRLNYFILTIIFGWMKSILPIFFRNHRNTPYAAKRALQNVCTCNSRMHVRENSVPVCVGIQCTDTHSHTATFSTCARTRVCLPASAIGFSRGGRDKETSRGGERCDYNSTRFRVVSEWVKTSQSVSQASRQEHVRHREFCHEHPWTILVCVIDEWSWIVTIERVFFSLSNEREGTARNAVVTNNYDSIGVWKRCTAIGLLPARSA